MATYRRKPVEVQAWPVTMLLRQARGAWHQVPEPVEQAYERGDIVFADDHMTVRNLDGKVHRGDPGDMLVRDTRATLFTMDGPAFLDDYEAAPTVTTDKLRAAFLDGALWAARQFPGDAPFSLDDTQKAAVDHFREG